MQLNNHDILPHDETSLAEKITFSYRRCASIFASIIFKVLLTMPNHFGELNPYELVLSKSFTTRDITYWSSLDGGNAGTCGGGLFRFFFS